jgi:hypothetical protein
MANAPSSTLVLAAGVRHVTYLSAFGTDQASPEVALSPTGPWNSISWAAAPSPILRPAWFTQNLSETFLRPVDGVITASFAGFARRTAHAWARQGA